MAALGDGASTADLLRPLFCTVEVNLDSRLGSSISSGNLGGAVTDPSSLAFGSINFTNEQYDAVLEENNQRVAGLPGEVRRDTLGSLAHISRGAADVDYQERLRSEGIVSREFIEDVLLIDFTRSIFSDDRCDLLAFAPELSSDDATAQNIAAGFISNLEAASPAEGTPAGGPAAQPSDRRRRRFSAPSRSSTPRVATAKTVATPTRTPSRAAWRTT